MLLVGVLVVLLGWRAHITRAQTCVPPPEGLVSWWQGEGDATDIVSGNDGTLQGGTTFVPGLVGQAFSFDGIDDYIRVPNHPSLSPTEGLTIEAWVNFASTDGAHTIIAKCDNDCSYIFKDWDDDDKLSIELSESSFQDLASLRSSTSLPLETWVHVATTYDATEGVVRLYMNGLEDASLAVGANRPIRASLADVFIGATVVNSQNFAGLIDEVSIYNRALSAEDIAAIFAAGSAGKCAALRCNGLVATIVGTDGHDVLLGTEGDDVIAGLGGNDTIDGLEGDDVICGGPGHDVLLGGAAHDVLLGGPGNDTLSGGEGNDILLGGPGNDTLSGGPGIDLLFGEEGNDTLEGEEDTDVLLGGPGNDTCTGGSGEQDFADECEVVDTAL
jgi:Ca2+-binding RTX toxin-like protein